MKILDNIIDNLVRFIMALSTLVLSIVTTIQVISRYIFHNPIGWGQDVVRLSFIYLVFWGGAYCVKEKAHLNIDVLFTIIKPSSRKVLELGINLLLLFFFIFIIYYGFIFTQTGMSQKSPYLSIPMSYYYLSLPTAGMVMVYYQIKQIFGNISELKSSNTGGNSK